MNQTCRKTVSAALLAIIIITMQGCRKNIDTPDPNSLESSGPTKAELNPDPDDSRCAQDSNLLSLKDVLIQPYEYDGKKIVLDCYYLEGFETVILASDVKVHKDNSFYAADGDVWASWRINPPKDALAKLKELPGLFPGGRQPLYGRVIVEGIFTVSNENGIGHMGEYKYGFEIQNFRVYDETSGKFYP